MDLFKATARRVVPIEVFFSGQDRDGLTVDGPEGGESDGELDFPNQADEEREHDQSGEVSRRGVGLTEEHDCAEVWGPGEGWGVQLSERGRVVVEDEMVGGVRFSAPNSLWSFIRENGRL